MQVHDRLHLVVHNQDNGGPDGTERVGSGALEQRRASLILDDLGEAVGGSLVQPLRRGLFVYVRAIQVSLRCVWESEEGGGD